MLSRLCSDTNDVSSEKCETKIVTDNLKIKVLEIAEIAWRKTLFQIGDGLVTME